MGSACCVAARDKTISSGPRGDILNRNIRYSPTWSFRWENRGRVAGEDASVSWFSDGISRHDGSELKYESAFTSENGSPLGSSRGGAWQKSPSSEGNARTPASDQTISRNVSLVASLEQAKESADSPAVSYPSPRKLSLSLPLASSVSTSPLSSQSHLHSPSTNTSRWPHHSPGHHLPRQASDSRALGLKSSNICSINEERQVLPAWSNESNRGSYEGSSDGWSMHAFSELVANSQRERWSFDSESFGFNREKLTRSSSQYSASPGVDLQTCGVCLKLLTEKSLWRSQKIISCNELSVVAVLICGHIYHAECLENMTPEIDKYDPPCPVCTLGEKQAHKLSEKALKVGMELKAKQCKRSRSRIVDSDLENDSFVFDHFKGIGREGKSPKLASSSSTKISSAKPFLRRHFSFGSKGSKPISENGPAKKKGFFWTRSSKI